MQQNLSSNSSSKSRVEIENEVFNDLMYKGEVPKRPLNYGFGVKKSDIFGVEGLLRKEGSGYVNNSAIEVENLKVELSVVKKQNKDLALQNQVLGTKFGETTQAFKMVTSLLGQVLKEVRNGNVSSELLDDAIHIVDSQVRTNFPVFSVFSVFLFCSVLLCSCLFSCLILSCLLLSCLI